MTGIERLRELAGGINPRSVWSITSDEYDDAHGLDFDHKGGQLRDFLADIADQIERELTCDEDTIENVRLIVGGVVDDMERHVSGVEGMEDSPVARWARELRHALKSYTSGAADAQNPSWHDPADAAGVTSDAPKVTRDPAEDVSMSAYDLLPEDEREAITWVRQHGGLDYVKSEWRSRVPYDRYERRRQRLLGHIAECETALGRRNRRIEELGHRVSDLTTENAELRKRAMPEGYEWPRYESGEPVRIGDVVSDVEVRSVVFRDGGILLSDCTSVPGWGTWRSYKEPIKRPAPKVLDADGVEIYEGRIAYGTRGRKYRVTELCEHEPSIVHAQAIDDGELGDEFIVANTGLNSYQLDASKLTHERPVLGADGEPLREGETVWHVKTGREYVVVEPSYGDTVVVRLAKYDDAEGEQYAPDQLTHERPVADTWERLEEDAEKNPCDYFGFDGEETCGKCPASGKNCEQTMARDLVRRAKALAERERSE